MHLLFSHEHGTIHFDIIETQPTTEHEVPATSQKPQCTQLTPKTASVVPPEDGRLTPETCRGLRHNKVILKVKVY
jgi:hypothetical protein